MPPKPAVGFILACIFLDALGIGLIVPVLPRLIGTLAETRDAQAWWYGLIMLSYGVMQFASSPLLGALSDRIGRRPVLLGGILGLGVTFAVPACTSSLPLILASRVVGGMLSANMTVAQAYIADITKGLGRCSAFGKIGAAFGVGFVLGPALGGILGESDPRWPFVAAAAISLANFLYGAFVLPESLTQRAARPVTWKSSNPLKALFDLTRVPANRLFLLILTFTCLANALMQCTWALYTEFRYGFTPLAIGLSVFALGLSIAFMQGVVLQKILRRFRPREIVLTVLAIGSAAMAAVALSPFGWGAAVACCLYAVMSASSPILTGEISRRTIVTEQGRTMGAVSSLNSLTGALAPLLGTPLLMFSAKHTDDLLAGSPYFVCSGLLLAALVAVLLASRMNIDFSTKRFQQMTPETTGTMT